MTVLGVLSILFGAFGAIGTLMTIAIQFAARQGAMPSDPVLARMNQGPLKIWTDVMLPVSVLGCVFLVVCGIGLLRMWPWARLGSIYYAIASIVIGAVGLLLQAVFLTIPLLREGPGDPSAFPARVGAVAGLVGGAFGFIFPALTWYFLTRRHVIDAFAGKWTPPAETPHDLFAQAQVLSIESTNPYAAAPQASSAIVLPSDAPSIVEAFVPAKNGPALWAYYLGLFSLFPILGFPLAPIAVYCGILGLGRVRENPAVRGGAHAWVGILCGTFFGLFNLALVALMILGLVMASRTP